MIAAIKEKGSLEGIPDVPDDLRRIFATANEISGEGHVRMQAALQEGTDNAVSKTVNLPHQATTEDVAQVILSAYQEGCKGVTVYRQGSRTEEVIHRGEGKETRKSRLALEEEPEELEGVSYEVEAPEGNGIIYLFFKDEKPFEVVVQITDGDYFAEAQAEALGRLVSVWLRSRPVQERWLILALVAEQLRHIGTYQPKGFGPHRVESLPDALAKIISEVIESTPELEETISLDTEDTDFCPECGKFSFVKAEGCETCLTCGHSVC